MKENSDVEFDFLAAGNSIRFGSNKLLYRLNGKCMYRYGLEVVDALWQKAFRYHSDCDAI